MAIKMHKSVEVSELTVWVQYISWDIPVSKHTQTLLLL